MRGALLERAPAGAIFTEKIHLWFADFLCRFKRALHRSARNTKTQTRQMTAFEKSIKEHQELLNTNLLAVMGSLVETLGNIWMSQKCNAGCYYNWFIDSPRNDKMFAMQLAEEYVIQPTICLTNQRLKDWAIRTDVTVGKFIQYCYEARSELLISIRELLLDHKDHFGRKTYSYNE